MTKHHLQMLKGLESALKNRVFQSARRSAWCSHRLDLWHHIFEIRLLYAWLTESTSSDIKCSTKRQITFYGTEHKIFKFISKTGILDRSEYKPHYLISFSTWTEQYCLTSYHLETLRSQDFTKYLFKQKLSKE